VVWWGGGGGGVGVGGWGGGGGGWGFWGVRLTAKFTGVGKLWRWGRRGTPEEKWGTPQGGGKISQVESTEPTYCDGDDSSIGEITGRRARQAKSWGVGGQNFLKAQRQ